jgi:hypothetical protein
MWKTPEIAESSLWRTEKIRFFKDLTNRGLATRNVCFMFKFVVRLATGYFIEF